MAGDIKRQRKSWTLQDRSKVSINILRTNLAEEGDEDAQLDIAKRLFQESSDADVPERTRKENARLALYWLIKSSEQGNDEATQLLQECLHSGNGLTAQNILDVRTCVTTPKYEKLTFKAARLIHRKLCNGEEFITTAQLLARMNATGKSPVAFEGCPNTAGSQDRILREEENAEELLEEQQNVHTEKEENTTNSNPLLAKDAYMKDVDLNTTFTVPCNTDARSKASTAPSTASKEKLNRSFQSQSQMVLDELPPQFDLQFAMMQSGKKLTLNDLLEVAKDFNAGRTPKISVDERNKILSRHVWNVASFPNIFMAQLLILAVLGNLMHGANAIACTLFMGTIWSCYNCFLWKLRYNNFKDWKLAFESVLLGEWETEMLKWRQSIYYIMPHVIVFSLGFFLIPVLFDNELACVYTSLGILVIASIHFGLKQKLLPIWQHLIILITALMYYKSSFIVNLLGESANEHCSYLQHPLFKIEILDKLKFITGSIDVFTAMVFVTLSTTVKLSVQNFLSETIPDILLVLWLIKIVNVSAAVDFNDFFLSLCVGLAMCAVLRVLCSHLQTWKVFLVVSSAMLLIVMSGLISTSLHQDFVGSQNDELETSQVRFLEWEDYETLCHRKAWSVQSPAATQIKCSSLYADPTSSMLVKWKGRISIVKVEKLSRSRSNIKDLQDVVFDISVGIFPSHKDDGSRNWQNFLSGSSDTENIAPASVIVNTNRIENKKQKSDLIDHILNLRTGDKIEFVGKLKGSTAGSLKPQIIDIQSIRCLSCATADYGEFFIKLHHTTSPSTWLQKVLMELYTKAKNSHFYETTQNNFKILVSDVIRILTNDY